MARSARPREDVRVGQPAMNCRWCNDVLWLDEDEMKEMAVCPDCGPQFPTAYRKLLAEPEI